MDVIDLIKSKILDYKKVADFSIKPDWEGFKGTVVAS